MIAQFFMRLAGHPPLPRETQRQMLAIRSLWYTFWLALLALASLPFAVVGSIIALIVNYRAYRRLNPRGPYRPSPREAVHLAQLRAIAAEKRNV